MFIISIQIKIPYYMSGKTSGLKLTTKGDVQPMAGDFVTYMIIIMLCMVI